MEILDNNNQEYLQEKKYLLAKKRVEKIRGFYWHLIVYIAVNIMISGGAIYSLIKEDNQTFIQALTNVGVYATWIFWGLGLFFHWAGIFGFSFFLGKDWEQKQIKKYMDNDKF